MEMLRSQPREAQRLASYFSHVLENHSERERANMDGEEIELGEDISVDGIVRTITRSSGLSSRKLSVAMGRGQRYIERVIERGDKVKSTTLAEICDATHTGNAPNPATLYIQIGGAMHRITR